MTKGALILFSLALLFEQIRLGGKNVDAITFVFYILAGVMLFISVCIGIYAKQTLGKARDFLYYAWDLAHKADSDFHAVGGTD